MSNNRIEFVDIAKCLGIFLMIFGHSGLQGYPHDWIYSFHMPFFFLVSGLFLKQDSRPFLDTVKKNIRQLLVPYLFFYIITIPFGLVYIYFRGGEPVSVDYVWKPIVGMFLGVDRLIGPYSFFTNGPLWFLLALFWARILFAVNKTHNYSSLGIIVGACVSYEFLYKYIQFLNQDAGSRRRLYTKKNKNYTFGMDSTISAVSQYATVPECCKRYVRTGKMAS